MAKKKKKVYRANLFCVLYGVEFVGMLIFGVISRGGFLWTKIVSVLFISSLYVTAYIQDLIAHHKRFEIVYYSLIFLGSLLFFLLYYFSTSIFFFIAVLYSAAMMCLIFFRYVKYLRKSGDFESLDGNSMDIKPTIAAASLLLFVMLSMMSVNFVSEIFMAWSFIPAAILCAILFPIAFILFRKKFKAWASTTAKKVWTCIGIAVMVIFISFFYCYTTVGVVNCVFDYSDPTPIECTVLDKKVRSGARTPTQYEIKVTINNETEWIDVSSSDYDYIRKGETITVNYYPGALGIAYYLYEG